jgi:uncharacterized membrane protein
MTEAPSTLAAIAAMAAVTLACRCGGYFIFARVKPTPFIRNALAHLPGCIIVMIRTRNLGASIAAGVAATWGVTAFL